MKRILVAVAAVFTLLVAFAGPAFAQDPSISVDPGSVDEAGTYSFTVTGEGYSGPLFILPCPGANGDPAGMAEDSCDLNNLTPVSPTDGEFSADVEYDIPAEGLVIVGGNADQTEVAVAVITIAAAEEEEAAEEEADDDAAADDADDGDLAQTGNESAYAVLIGATMLGAGVLMLNTRRRIDAL